MVGVPLRMRGVSRTGGEPGLSKAWSMSRRPLEQGCRCSPSASASVRAQVQAQVQEGPPPPSPAHQHLGHGPPSASRAAEAAGRPPGGALGWGQGGGSTPGLGKLPQEPSSSRDSPGGVRLWVQEALQWVRDQR